MVMLETFEIYARTAGAQVSIVDTEAEAAALIGIVTEGTVKCATAVQEFFPVFYDALEAAGHPLMLVENSGAVPAYGHEFVISSSSSSLVLGALQEPPEGYGSRIETGSRIPAEPDRSELAAALTGGVGIVLAQAGIAETGSLVLADDALAPRLLSMLVDVCVVLLRASSILPGLDEAGALLSQLERAGHRYVSLITGPSRTADIERVLTIGVQGPKVLHIVVVR